MAAKLQNFGLAPQIVLTLMCCEATAISFQHTGFRENTALGFAVLPSYSSTFLVRRNRVQLEPRSTRNFRIFSGNVLRPSICCNNRRLLDFPLQMKQVDHDSVAILDDLLCQRAVQTQLYYFAEFRDGLVFSLVLSLILVTPDLQIVFFS